MNKILNNLLHNALKYAESYIEVEARSEGGNAVVSIRNDGPIIPKEHRSRIFEPFVQYGNDAKGVGIGLSLARTLAELHGGSLVLDDGTECTDFILTLPLRRTAAEPADGEEATAAPEGGPEKPGLPTLLIVEDNADLSAYLRRKLQGEYRILTAASAERALELLRQQEADLVLSDIALNGMSGLELCKRICGDFETSHIPVILLSALSSTRSKVVGMECGASLYIEKPFSMEYLQACIRNILDKRSAMKNAFKNKAMPLAAHLYNLPHSDEEFLSRLDAIILANISDPNFSNEQLAEAFCLSKSTLNRKIKGLLDTTPNDYIRTKRLVVAAQMLTENHCRINEVCYSVGFNTPSYFAKCFKKFYGILPAEYMKEHNAD
ncbi:response regulator [Alistipes senegalensis]|uniref:hybrid sensor histidine kinase/response regulator transcription factor n=1 Tax=Alistipes senegalensis TaxID=1288121 RepID=UPI00266F1352|nr:response regulator [Alistipes senegalensis]